MSPQLLLPAHFPAMVDINYEIEDSEVFCPILTQHPLKESPKIVSKSRFLLFSPGMTGPEPSFVLDLILQGLH